MGKRDRLITKRTNIFDGQRVTETDLDTEQIHNNALVSNLVVDFHGSGVVKTSPFEDIVLYLKSIVLSQVESAFPKPNSNNNLSLD